MNSPEHKQHSNTVTSKESLPYFSMPLAKPSSFMNMDINLKKITQADLKERYKKLKKNPEFRLTCNEIALNGKINFDEKKETDKKTEKMKSKHHLEEKLKTFSANLSHLKSNNDGFHKSLDLVNGLIKGLDLKIQKIRELKEVSPRITLCRQGDTSPINEVEMVFETP